MAEEKIETIKKPSAAAQVRALVEQNAEKITADILAKLEDKEFCKAKLHIIYPMFVEERNDSNKRRYGAKELTIAGKTVYLTNNFYARNIKNVSDAFANMDTFLSEAE